MRKPIVRSLLFACPRCGVQPNAACVTTSGAVSSITHRVRIDLIRTLDEPETDMFKPSDEEIVRRWKEALRLFQYKDGTLRKRVALALVDRLENEGVTEADLDRLGL